MTHTCTVQTQARYVVLVHVVLTYCLTSLVSPGHYYFEETKSKVRLIPKWLLLWMLSMTLFLLFTSSITNLSSVTPVRSSKVYQYSIIEWHQHAAYELVLKNNGNLHALHAHHVVSYLLLSDSGGTALRL